MKALLIQLTVPLAPAIPAWYYLNLAVWSSITPSVMFLLSVIGAAVLFRLGRGLPEFSVRELEIEDICKLTDAYAAVAKRLGVILALIGVTIVLLISIHFVRELPAWVCSAVASLAVYLLGLVLCRAVLLVKGDLDLIRLQAQLLVRDVRLSRAREKSDVLDEAKKASPFKNPPGYGGPSS